MPETTVNLVLAPQRGMTTALATYTVVVTSNEGATKDTVDIIVDFELLKSLALRAARNTTGRAAIHYGAVVAMVKK